MTIIAVDEDTRMLRQISELLAHHAEVMITTDSRKAMGWVENNRSVVGILAGETVRGESGVELLRAAYQLKPEIRRILITGYADLPAIVQGLHSGVIDRLLSKPLVPTEVSAAVTFLESRPPTIVVQRAAG